MPSQRTYPLIAVLIALLLSLPSVAQSPPKTFSIFCICETIGGLSDNPSNEVFLQSEMTRLKTQIGENHGRFRVGFAHIFRSEPALLLHCRLAQKNNLSVGTIIAVQTHDGLGHEAVLHDFRCAQWRLDGKTWEGQQAAKNQKVEFPARDWQVPTPSRYCTAVHDEAMTKTREKAEAIHRIMLEYPDVIVAVNASIEEELATSGETRDGLLADYSPFAITEFRDWLRHTGKYDDTTGEYAGQGAPEPIVGPLVLIHGAMRPQFYDDPTPDDANHTGQSFNQFFATHFSTWTLRNWDLDQFPHTITDKNFDPSPAYGIGYTAGGFDAPRQRDPQNKYWCAWSWDVTDHAGQYPPGNPDHPAFGFRQVEIKHFVSDVLDQIHQAGIPLNLIYAHQIPGEAVGARRALSGADPIWTGYYQPANTLGITRFGPINPAKITQYTHNWGIFEWHPKPFSKPDDPALYKATIDALNLYDRNGCRVLFAGWWRPNGKIEDIFPLNNSQFARAIHDWLATQK